MAKTLQQILGWENLTKLVTDVVGGIPDNLLDPGFLNLTRPVSGAVTSWTVSANTRQNARIVPYGSPSWKRQLQPIGDRSAKLVHVYEHQDHMGSTLVALRDFDSPAKQEKGQREVDRQVAEFGRRLRNTRVSAIASMLRHGELYIDSSGNILPTSSSASITVDFGVSANHKNQLNGIIGTTWATDSVDVAGDITAIKKQGLKDSGLPITTAYYGDNILEYLASNTALANVINGNPAFAQSFGQNEIPDGFLGLKWRPGYNLFFEDPDGTNQDWWGGDTIVFTPDVNRDWYEMQEGSFLIPNDLGGISGDAGAALGQLDEVNGMFNYAKVVDDPPRVQHFMGDTFLPVMYIPDAIFIADVVP